LEIKESLISSKLSGLNGDAGRLNLAASLRRPKFQLWLSVLKSSRTLGTFGEQG